jgi:hypothetical protein
VAELAGEGGIYLGRLDRKTRRRLKQQLMAPEWKLDLQGRRQVEAKDETKEKIGRSPDDADAMNLAYLPTPAARYQAHEGAPQEPPLQRNPVPMTTTSSRVHQGGTGRSMPYDRRR